MRDKNQAKNKMRAPRSCLRAKTKPPNEIKKSNKLIDVLFEEIKSEQYVDAMTQIWKEIDNA